MKPETWEDRLDRQFAEFVNTSPSQGESSLQMDLKDFIRVEKEKSRDEGWCEHEKEWQKEAEEVQLLACERDKEFLERVVSIVEEVYLDAPEHDKKYHVDTPSICECYSDAVHHFIVSKEKAVKKLKKLISPT